MSMAAMTPEDFEHRLESLMGLPLAKRQEELQKIYDELSTVLEEPESV